LILGINQNVTQLNKGHDLIELDRHLAKLSYADGAAFNSYHLQHEPRCIPNTRVDLLHQLEGWSTNSEKCIFWLSGMAGTGKSTIARTIASSFSKKGYLGASFFFSRGGGDLGHAGKFVSTLAYQLANVSPSLKRLICEAMAKQIDITRQGLHNQWKELIVGPLLRLGSSQSYFVFVIDALDECEHEDDVRLILQLFVQAKDLHLRVFLTSREETAIRLGFRDMPEIIHQDLDLHDIPRAIVEHDISEFLKHELGKIRKERNLPQSWPDEKIIRHLVDKSDCLFIYVATVCRFIGDRNWRPEKRLSQILQDFPSATTKLDDMYLQVLRHTIVESHDDEEKNELSKRFRQIVGPIVVLFDVLSSSVLGELLSIEREDIDLALGPLHSVLNIPKSHDIPIRLLHPSFRDCLLNKERCRDKNFWIDQEVVHMNLVKDCLQLLCKALKRNICNLESSGSLAHEVQSHQIDSHLPRDIQYACRYWVDHLEHVDPVHRDEIGLRDNGYIHSFLQKHFLHWLEALSLMQRMSEGVLMITKLGSLFKVSDFILPKEYFNIDSMFSLMTIPL
jgi:NACHT domain